MKKSLFKLAAVLASCTMLASIGVSASEVEPYYVVNGWRWPNAKAVMYFESLSGAHNNQANYAASDWNNALNGLFTFSKSSSNTTNSVKYGTLSGTNKNALAITSVSHSSSKDSDGWYKILKAPVTLNSSFSWDTSSNSCSSSKFHLRSVLRHEFGHVLGLNHSGTPSACLYPSMSKGEIKTLSSDDIKGGKDIYGDFAKSTLNQFGLDASGINEITEVCILYPEYTPVELAKESENIIVGTVESIEDGYSSDGNIYSRVNISVSDNLKGDVNSENISIPMFGGVQGDTVYTYENAPKYEVGEEFVLYLSNISDSVKSSKNDASPWYLPKSYSSIISLNSTDTLSLDDKNLIIEQVKDDIENAKNYVASEHTITGDIVEDSLLMEE